jgi:hypothetical protein
MRTIIIGDVHGCLEEFDELLKVVQHVPDRDRLILVGDLIDRGPDPVGVVRRVREMGAESVMGNHEDKCVQWFHREELRKSSGRINRMSVHPDRLVEWGRLSRDDLDWMESLPVVIQLPEGWWVVHAGFEAGPMGDQRPDKMMRVCHLDPSTGRMKSPDRNMDQRPGTVPWTDMWPHPESVVYGHSVHVDGPRVDWPSLGVACVGIDTGCVFGGPLTAMILDGGRVDFAQVRPKVVHFNHPKIREPTHA